MERVVKCTVFLADMAEWGAMNEAYREVLPEPAGAQRARRQRTRAVARVEIECIAAMP